jgi:hypothetical protein
MMFTNERLIRSGIAAVVAAVAAIAVVSDYHPCDGIGRLLIFPFITAPIALVASLPNVSPRAVLLPGAIATTVLAVAMGLDYTASDVIAPENGLCEPVEGVAGFLLAAVFSTVMGGLGVGVVALIAWVVNGTMRWRSRPGPSGDQARSTGTP